MPRAYRACSGRFYFPEPLARRPRPCYNKTRENLVPAKVFFRGPNRNAETAEHQNRGVVWMREAWKNATRLQKIILVIALILWIPLLGCIIYGIYLDLQPPPPLSPMQKQTERYAHNFGFP